MYVARFGFGEPFLFGFAAFSASSFGRAPIRCVVDPAAHCAARAARTLSCRCRD
jgi:hypothetical protein